MHAYGLHMNVLIVVKHTCMHAINIALMHACILHMNAFINWVASVKIDWVGDEHYNASFVFIVMSLGNKSDISSAMTLPDILESLE
mgnify:CR=1 FL=1